MTVKELIELLKQEDPEAEVFTEGCDCDAEAKGVRKEDSGSVMITRS